MKYDYIQKVYFNKEITDRPLDDYGDRLGRFCTIEMKKMDHQEGRKKRICEMLTCIMKLMGYPDEISNENFSGKIEINHCWISEDDAKIYIQHKYWNGHEMKLFCDITEALGKYLHFETEYLSAEKMRSIGA
jgi:adenylate cyclase class IV